MTIDQRFDKWLKKKYHMIAGTLAPCGEISLMREAFAAGWNEHQRVADGKKHRSAKG